MTSDKFQKAFEKGLITLIKFDQQTLDDQGHRATGKLIDTLRYEVKFNGDTLTGELIMQEYGLKVDQGTSARDVFRVDPRAIKTWAKIVKPNLSNEEIDSFVAATFARWDKEGIPLNDGNSPFSKDGRRTGWIGIGTDFYKDNCDDLFQVDPVLNECLEQSLRIIQNQAA